MKDVNYVFHAAALKMSPHASFPLEATKTNVLGTNNVLTSAIYHQVENVICLSTESCYQCNGVQKL